MRKYIILGAACKSRERQSASPLWRILRLNFQRMEPPCPSIQPENPLKAGLHLVHPDFCKWLLAIMILSGCSAATKDFYVLSTTQEPEIKFAAKHFGIAVENIIIPKYLTTRKILVAKNANQISMIDGVKWGEDLDVGLTNRLVSFLQKKFQQPIYQFPWASNGFEGLKVKVRIVRFIAQGDSVYLEANWEIDHLNSPEITSKLFNTTVSLDASTTNAIVTAMDKAFGQLETQIAEGIQEL